VNIEEQKQKVSTARWSVAVASTMPGVDAASYASNYLKKYYNDLVDDEPTAPDDSGKKKGGKKRKTSTVDLTIDEDADSFSDESTSRSIDTASTDSSDNE
jgi:hypothetical protein